MLGRPLTLIPQLLGYRLTHYTLLQPELILSTLVKEEIGLGIDFSIDIALRIRVIFWS